MDPAEIDASRRDRRAQIPFIIAIAVLSPALLDIFQTGNTLFLLLLATTLILNLAAIFLLGRHPSGVGHVDSILAFTVAWTYQLGGKNFVQYKSESP